MRSHSPVDGRKMKRTIDIDALLEPIPGENPSGDDLRYTPVYDDIKEARRSEESLAMGDWHRETKSSNWDKVAALSLEALAKRTKDLQIASWLTEALTMLDGFEGLESGMRVISGFMDLYWDTVYPLIEEDDLDYRIAPFEFLNEKLSSCIRQTPLTEPKKTPGYSLQKWQESRAVGYENDSGQARRDELIAEGKIQAEEFDTAVAKSSAPFYHSLLETLTRCSQAFETLDTNINDRFGSHAPRTSDMGQALEECTRLVSRICREQKGLGETQPQEQPLDSDVDTGSVTFEEVQRSEADTDQAVTVEISSASGVTRPPSPVRTAAQPLVDVGESEEETLWNEATRTMRNGGFRDALSMLLDTANRQPSERGRRRCQLLVAKLCLKADRPDLARPILEQLHSLVNELQLERWESPLWIAEVFESLYQCLVSGEPTDEDMGRSQELFRTICTMDVTKAMVYRK